MNQRNVKHQDIRGASCSRYAIVQQYFNSFYTVSNAFHPQYVKLLMLFIDNIRQLAPAQGHC